MIGGRVSPCLQLSEGHHGGKVAFNPLVEAYGSDNHCCAASWGLDVCRTFDYNDYRFHHAIGVPVDFNFDAYAFVLQAQRTANCLRYQVLVDQSLHLSSTTPLRSRLLDERNSVSVSAGSDEYTHEEGLDRLGDPEDEQLVIIDGWQDLLEILHQQTPSPDSLIHLEMYGLHITHHSIRITDCESTIAAIREAVQQSWRDTMPPQSVAYIHLVRPQEQRHARAVVLQMIVEVVPFGVDIPPNDVPILRRIRWHSDHSITLETAYMRDHQTGYELLFDAHLDEWCHPRHGVQCNLHIESQIALMAHRHHLLPGSLLEIFIHDDDRPEPSTSSQHVDPQSGLPQPATDGFDILREWLVDWPHPQVSLVMYGLLGSSLGTRYATSQVDFQQVREAVLQAWQAYIQPDTSVTLHIVRPQDDRQPNHLHLIIELTNPSQARPAGYLPILQRISWHNIWQGDTSVAVYRVPGQNMRELIAACGLAEWCGPSTRAICRMQVERRSIPITELIVFQAGSLLEVFVSLQHVEDDGASLLQSGTPTSTIPQATIGHAEPSSVPLGSLSTHVIDRWCDSLSSCDVQQLASKARITQARPNGDIVPDQDNQVPYQYRLHNGARIPGTIIPPPNWNRLPGLRYASDRGAVVRDAAHQLRVRIRSWLVPHDRFGPEYWKDCTIPAQLFLRLLDRLKSVWQPELLQGDRLRMRIVQPTPAPPVGEQARLYILLECNRPHISTRKAILLSFQEFTSAGPSPDMTWIPYLAPEVITPQIVAGALPMPCDPRHLIISAGTPDRRWLAEQDERAVDNGLYLPILRDVRRGVPTQRIEIDDVMLIQTGLLVNEDDDLPLLQHDEDEPVDALQLMQRSSSRSPRRGLPPSTSTDGSGPDLLLVHTYHMSASHKLVHLDKSRPLSYSAQIEEIWRFPPHTSILGLHEVRHPPQDLESTSQATLLIERTVDLHRQAIADDQLVLADLVLSGAGTVDPIQIRRVVWTRGFMARPAVLHLFATQEFCSSPEVTCHLSVNRVVWSQHDTASRELRHGDFFCLRIAGPLTMTNEEIRTVLTDQEHADSSRYLYYSSPARSPRSPTTPEEGGESEHEIFQDPPVDATDSADPQVIRKTTPSRLPLADVTNSNRLDAHLDAWPASQPDTMNSSGLPHVDDLWCASPVGFRVPDCLAEPDPPDNASSTRQCISLQSAIPPQPEVFVPCSHLHFIRNQLLDFDLGAPGSKAQLVKWHDSTQEAFESTPDWQGELPISYEFFTDGSSAYLDDERQGAAAVVLIVNTIHGPRFGGTHCFSVDSPATAPRSEIVAMLGALLWAVELAGKHPSPSPHFCFGFDCNLAGLAAAGVWTPLHHLELQSVARSLCHWLQSRFGDSALEWKHIKSHTGHPWNEAADALSWAAVAQWVPSQDLLSRLPDLLLLGLHSSAHQWLWFLEHSLQGRPGAPAVDVHGFHFPLALPFDTVPCSRNHPLISRQNGSASQGPRHETPFTLRCGTANVLTLQSKGLGARAEHLALQFQQAKVHCMGLQETRSYSSGHQFFGSFHVLSAPAVRGVGGTQFWIQSTFPTEVGTVHIRPSDLRILAATSQRLIVCLKHEAIHLIFIIAHAPSDGDLLHFERFWKTTSEAIPNAYRHWKQIYLVDANARLGSIESDYVGSFGAEDENTAGSLFHQWLATQSLIAPQTFAQHHSGQHATWTHANGGHKARLDYVLVDASLYSAAIRTWVSSEIDLSLERADHDCVCADIPLTLWPPSPSKRNAYQAKPVPSPEPPPVVPWRLDVHTHAAQVQNWLSSLTPTTSTAVPRKQHLSSDTWSFVQKKKYHFKRYTQCRRELDKHVLLAVFQAWRCSDESAVDHPSPSEWKRLCDHSLAFHSAMASRYARKVTQGVRADDKQFYNNLAQHHGTVAADEGLPSFWKTIKHLLPKARKKQRSNIRCIGPEMSELCDHYNNLEAGSPCDYSTLLSRCFERQKRALDDAPLQMRLEDLPSRQEVEQIGHRQKRGRAPGIDGVTSDVIHQILPTASDVLTTLYIKAWILGAEPAQFKGGLMHSIAKKSGSTTASGMRGIVLLDSTGKLYHGILRRKMIQSIPALPSQLGGYRGQQTLFATQLLRSHCAVTACRHLSTATVFIDVRSAFHCLLREHAFGTRASFPPRIIDVLQHENLDIGALTVSMQEHSQLFVDHASPGLARAVQDAHQDTWYVLPRADSCFATARGSRPGSPLADIAFNILMSSLLQELTALLIEHDVQHGVWEVMQLPSPVVAWMDDVAFPVSTTDAIQLDGAIERLMPQVRQIFESFGLRLNTTARKTEVVCQYRGRNSPALREHRFVECLGQFRLNDGTSLRAVPTYEHLGTMFAQSATVQAELRTRIGKATAAYREMAKAIFGNKHVPIATRLQLLESLVLPVLLYGCGTWPVLSERQFQKLNHVIIGWQRKIANDGFWQNDCSSDWEFQAKWKLIPLGLRLAKHRLLYAFKLVQNAPQLVLDYVTAENDLCSDSWLQAVAKAVNWLLPRQHPAPRGAPEPEPTPPLEPTSTVLVTWLADHRVSGPRLMRRAIRRFLQEEHMMGMVYSGHRRIFDLCATFVPLVTPSADPAAALQGASHFPCGLCSRSFSSVQARQGHHWKFHGHFSIERKFVHGSTCVVCGQCFWTSQRMQQHLRYSRKFGDQGCLAQMQRFYEPLESPVAVEIPSVLQHYHRLPRCATPGPHSRPDYPVWKRRVHQQLLDWKAEWTSLGLELAPDVAIHDKVRADLSSATCAWATSLPLDYVCSKDDSTLEEFWLPVLRQPDVHDEQILWAFVAWGSEELYELQAGFDSLEVQKELEEVFLSVAECLPVYRLLGRKQQLLNWLQKEPVVPLEPVLDPAPDTRQNRPREPIPSSLHQQASLLMPQLDRRLRSMPCTNKGVPIVIGPQGKRTLYVLHLFSGRRRHGDCHYWFHELIHDYFPDYEIVVFSVDTAIHDRCGNLASGKNYELLWHLACQGLFALCISGPPCETWSAARHLLLEGAKFAPRPLRSSERPWGLDGRSLRELCQLTTGSELMINHLQLETAVVLNGGGALIKKSSTTSA